MRRGLVIGGLIGIGAACLFTGPKIRRYDILFNMHEIKDELPVSLLCLQDGGQHNQSASDSNKKLSHSGGGGGKGPEDNNNRTGSVDNMAKFFMTSKFGKTIKDKIEKTKKRFQGKSVYRVRENVPEYNLRKGDQLYLDAKHKDHIEVFRKDGTAKTVLNLDGTENFTKAAAANNRMLR